MGAISAQVLTRLTPLVDALAALGSIRPVAIRQIAAAHAAGYVLAADAVAPVTHPPRAQALLDGFAVNAEATLGASPYAPILVDPLEIVSGAPLPDGTDAVASIDAVQMRNETIEVTAPLATGAGVLEGGGDCAAGTVLLRARRRICASDVAVFMLAGMTHVSVRSPNVAIGCARESAVLGAAANMIAHELQAQRVETKVTSLDTALTDDDADAIIGIGGTGSGTNDQSVQALDRAGRVVFHGVGLMPGETAAFGFVGEKPVLLLPGRLDAALAVWRILGQRLIASLCDGDDDVISMSATLTRKVTSSAGIAEFVPLRIDAGKAEPLGVKHLPLSVLAAANGWILVPQESEGYQAGASVKVHPWR